MKKNNNKETALKNGVEARLEALIAITAGLMRVTAADLKSKYVSGAEDKAIMALLSAGMPQVETGKLIGVDTHRVNEMCKKFKK